MQELLAFAVAAALQTLIHEGAHALACRLVGGTVQDFKPYPHRSGGRWWFGRMRCSVPPGKRQIVTLAPMVVAAAEVLLFVVVSPFVVLPDWLVALSCVPLVDLCFNLLVGHDGRESGLSRNVRALLASLALSVWWFVVVL